MPKREQRALAALYMEAGRPVEDSSALMSDKVAHGPAAAVLLEREYGRLEPEFMEAIARHTVGKPGMGKLATILYCADKLEPGRERLKDGYREACLALPLDAMLLAVVEGSISWMLAQGKAVAPETMILYSTLSGGIGIR
jgi:nicotinate-nucleotide adenylyltransferase